MALSGIQIYKLLPQTNCKECGFPTCLAFAMKLAAKQVELSMCPYVSEESKAQLAESAAPPIRLISIKSNGNEVKAGNEVVLFRHEKTFYHKPGMFIKVPASMDGEALTELVKQADQFNVNYVGIDLVLDGFAVLDDTGDPQNFASGIQGVRGVTQRPLVLMSDNPVVIEAGLEKLPNEKPLIYAASANNLDEMVNLATKYKTALVIKASSLDELADLTEKAKANGLEDLVLMLDVDEMSTWLTLSTQIRRLAIKKNFRSLGYPILALPKTVEEAAQAITKYAGFIVLDQFSPASAYGLLVLRQNIYTDPQKPIQVLPGIYEINNPKPDNPVLVTTNFSITYFSVANEVESAGLPAWLLVCDAEGMSVLTAWAAGKFDAERIAKSVKSSNVADKVSRKLMIIPGHVAVLSGELEAELPDWEIRVGPREALDLPKYMKTAL